MTNLTLSGIIDAIKLAPQHWFAVAIVSTVILLLPVAVTDAVGSTALIITCRAAIGLTCIASWSMLLAHVLCALKNPVLERYKEYRLVKGGRKVLQKLSPREKALLSEYIVRKTKSLTFPLSDGTVMGLVHVMVLYRASQVSEAFDSFAFNLHPWAWTELKANPELLEPEFSRARENIAGRKGQ